MNGTDIDMNEDNRQKNTKNENKKKNYLKNNNAHTNQAKHYENAIELQQFMFHRNFSTSIFLLFGSWRVVISFIYLFLFSISIKMHFFFNSSFHFSCSSGFLLLYSCFLTMRNLVILINTT